MLIQMALVFFLAQVPENGEVITFQPDTFFELSQEMKDFCDQNIMIHANEYSKYNSLLTTMFDEDGLGMTYSNRRTTPPKQTFALRTGNCLSFTGMFIAMARYCGFDAQFEEVSDLSKWAKKGDYTVYNRHMICSIMLDGRRNEIDFNYHKKRVYQFINLVSDKRGIAHFYNNLGAEALGNDDVYLATIYLEKAIETDPKFSFGWTNLGIIRRINGHFDEAEICYRKASKLNRMDQTPIMNLAFLYQIQGKDQQAKRLMKKVKRFQAKNPYHHYELGKNAYNNGQYKEAITHLKRAVKIHDTHPKFMLSLAAAYKQAGQTKKAQSLIKKAKENAETYDTEALYDKKLQLLANTN